MAAHSNDFAATTEAMLNAFEDARQALERAYNRQCERLTREAIDKFDITGQVFDVPLARRASASRSSPLPCDNVSIFGAKVEQYSDSSEAAHDKVPKE